MRAAQSDAKEFLRAFNKNNQQTATTKSTAIKQYLDLYINSRLKIREAYDRGYDTLPNIVNEIENLRGQVIENYMSDPDAIIRLSKEAFKRSLKDIHVAHIFLSLKNTSGNIDSVAARKKLNEVTSVLVEPGPADAKPGAVKIPARVLAKIILITARKLG